MVIAGRLVEGDTQPDLDVPAGDLDVFDEQPQKGLALGVVIFLSVDHRRHYRSHLTWRPRGRQILAQLRLGVPMGLMPVADLLGFAIFQMMQTRLGTTGGAATQLVVILTSLAYMPGYGIASAGTTSFSQS